MGIFPFLNHEPDLVIRRDEMRDDKTDRKEICGTDPSG